MLRCSDRTLYTGITSDLDRRLAAHHGGTASKYTRGRLPVRLVFQERHSNRSRASKREAAIKKLSRSAKLALVRPR
jgi:putative endonuclease